MRTGDLVWWRYTARGGYGYTRRIPGVFLRQTMRRVAIEVLKRDGTRARRFVLLDNVEPRRADETIVWSR